MSNVTNITIKPANQNISLKETVQQNWNSRKVQVIGSGVSALALASGVATAALLGGPVSAIIALAAAAFVALALFLGSLLAKPQSQKQEIAQPQTPVMAQPVEQAQKKGPVPQQKGMVEKAVSYAKEHPYQTAAVCAAALAATGAGLYLLGGFGTRATSNAVAIYNANRSGAPIAMMNQSVAMIPALTTLPSAAPRLFPSNSKPAAAESRPCMADYVEIAEVPASYCKNLTLPIGPDATTNKNPLPCLAATSPIGVRIEEENLKKVLCTDPNKRACITSIPLINDLRLFIQLPDPFCQS